jgi:hypothetical protein
LQLAQVGRALGQIQFTKTRADGAGADDGHGDPALVQRGYLCSDSRDELGVELLVLVGQELRAELDDDGADRGEDGLSIGGGCHR